MNIAIYKVNEKQKMFLGILIMIACLIPLLAVPVSKNEMKHFRAHDIFYIWTDGESIAHGIDPYSRIHGSDMLQNKKYSTYLPGFFLIATTTILMGVNNFEDFLNIWLPTSLCIHWLVGMAIFIFCFRISRNLPLSLFGALFWTLGRWSLAVMRSGQIDLLAIAFIILAFAYMQSNKIKACLFFGASLAIKQIGVFALPLFILFVVDTNQLLKNQFIEAVKYSFWVLLIPFLVVLPFLIWDWSGFFLSILFSATRIPGGIKVESLDYLLGWIGITGKIPLMVILAFVYWLAWRRVILPFQGAMLCFLSFITFNSVLFNQYIPWFVAFVGFAAAEAVAAISATKSNEIVAS